RGSLSIDLASDYIEKPVYKPDHPSTSRHRPLVYFGPNSLQKLLSVDSRRPIRDGTAIAPASWQRRQNQNTQQP
ncbi:unnamed protein product, partial [Heterosigma akashiwo]